MPKIKTTGKPAPAKKTGGIKLGSKKTSSIGAVKEMQDAGAVRKEHAERLVAAFHEKREIYDNARAEFEVEYPDADRFLKKVDNLRHEAVNAAEAAKAAVREAEVSIGEFTYRQNKAKAYLDGQKALSLILEARVASELSSDECMGLIESLYNKGVINGLSVDAEQSRKWQQRYPQEAEQLEDAWVPEGPGNKVVSTPKV